MKTTYIYTLENPVNGDIRYVGKSNNPKHRYRTHLCERGSYYKIQWIKSLKKIGQKPALYIIDEIPDSEWKFWEQYYISLFKTWGFKLTNFTDGGDGANGISGEMHPMFGKHHSQETKDKIRNTKLGVRQHSQEFKDKISRIHKGKIVSNETKKRMSDKRKGRKISEEQKNKISVKISKPVIHTGTRKIYNSVKEASIDFGINHSNLSQCLLNKRKNNTGLIYYDKSK